MKIYCGAGSTWMKTIFFNHFLRNEKGLYFGKAIVARGGFAFLKVRRPNTPDCLLRMKAASGSPARDFMCSSARAIFGKYLPNRLAIPHPIV
jgi:hypothetical protein